MARLACALFISLLMLGTAAARNFPSQFYEYFSQYCRDQIHDGHVTIYGSPEFPATCRLDCGFKVHCPNGAEFTKYQPGPVKNNDYPSPYVYASYATADSGSPFGQPLIDGILFWLGIIAGSFLLYFIFHKQIDLALAYTPSSHPQTPPTAATIHAEPSQPWGPPPLASNDPVPQQSPQATTEMNTAHHGLLLLTKRTQREGAFGKVLFALDVRIQPNAEQLALIRKYNLGKNVVYDSAARRHHANAAVAHADAAAQTPNDGSFVALGKMMFRGARAATRATAAVLSLRCTIDSLMAGQHIECKDMDELLMAEEAIKEACENVKSYLTTAATFHGGEQVHEF